MFSIKNSLKENWGAILFWTMACILLFFNLGLRNIFGSEGRWACVVREMFASGDFLHPTVNGISYFDKPLGSYWLIALYALFNGKNVTELVIRIPSAIAALGFLWSVRSMARSLWKEPIVAQYVAWLTLGVYAVTNWGRLGEADMLNLFFSTLAVAWYLKRRGQISFWTYLVFGVICALGGQTKGMSAIAIPIVAVFIDIAMSRRLKENLNWRLCLAVVLSIALYLLPFVAAAGGLSLAVRENIVRYFNAFDHIEPWYAYFHYLPRLFLPWTPFLILALAWALFSWKRLDSAERWCLLCIIAIFVIFSASDSKRVYYILPILPYCALLTGRFLSGTSAVHWGERISRGCLKALLWLCVIAAGGLLLAPIVFLIANRINPVFSNLPPDVKLFFLLAPLPCAFIFAILWYIAPRLTRWCRSEDLLFFKTALCVAWCIWVACSVAQPFIDSRLRVSHTFFKQLRAGLDAESIPPSQLAFWETTVVDAVYYMDYSVSIKVLKTNDELAAFWKTNPNAVVVFQRQALERVKDKSIVDALGEPWKEEPKMPWEHQRRFKKKYIAFKK